MPVLDQIARCITPDTFAPFGQMIRATSDGTPYGPDDAQLELSLGIPRFYLMRLPYKELIIRRITRHRRCTQCLGSLLGQEWFLAVAPPRDLDQSDAVPDLNEIVTFRIPGTCFVKLHRGTWHAGPYFLAPHMDFYNLELSDTNISDHHTCNLELHYQTAIRIGIPDL
ncbi:MAG: hypothetical protein OHK0012_01630 [Synechococcales cyanobacterium]